MCGSREQLLLLSVCLCPLQRQHFREEKYTTVYSFVHSSLSCLFLICKTSRKLFVTVTHHQILRGDFTEPHWFTHSRLCWRSMSWQHSPVNTVQVPSCWYWESFKSFLPSFCCAFCSQQLPAGGQGDKFYPWIQYRNWSFSWCAGTCSAAAAFLECALTFTFLSLQSCCDEPLKYDSCSWPFTL